MSSVHQLCVRLKTETGKALPEASRKDLALLWKCLAGKPGPNQPRTLHGAQAWILMRLQVGSKFLSYLIIMYHLSSLSHLFMGPGSDHLNLWGYTVFGGLYPCQISLDGLENKAWKCTAAEPKLADLTCWCAMTLRSTVVVLEGLQPQTTQAQLNLTLGCATLNLAPQAIAQRPGCGKPCFYTSKVRAACRFSLEPTGELAWMKVEVLMTLRSWSQAMYTPFFPLGTIWGDSKTTTKTI